MRAIGTTRLDAQTLQEHVTAFVRAEGTHRPDETPCGQPMSASEVHALFEIARESPLSQKTLAERLRLEKSTVSRLVTRLEERAWVCREPHPRDGRSALLALTPRGEEAAERLDAARSEKFRNLLAAIPEEQQARVLDALMTLTRAFEEAAGSEDGRSSSQRQ